MTSLAQKPETETMTSGWAPVFWEPVAETSERLMVGVIVHIDGQTTAHRIIRDDVLECLYGKAANGARNLIDFSLNDLRLLARHGGMDAVENTASGGLVTGSYHATGQTSMPDALRTAAIMYSSMAAIDKLDEQEAEDSPQPDEVNRRFATEVREYVVGKRPELRPYFGRKAEILQAGLPVAFGFCSEVLAAHFGTLHPVRQAGGVRDARAKLWELQRLREHAQIQTACLIIGIPGDDDPTLSTKQRLSIKENITEIEREADSHEMRMFPVHSAADGGERLIQHAKK